MTEFGDEILIGCDLLAVVLAMGQLRKLSEWPEDNRSGWRTLGLPEPENNGVYVKYLM